MINRLLLCSALVLGLHATASAGFEYSLIFDQSDYSAAPGGGPITVNVLLQETVTGGDTARLATGGGDGLFALGATLDFSSFTGVQSTISGVGDISLDSSFDDTGSNTISLAASSAQVQGLTTSIDGIEVGAPASTLTVPFASFVFTPGAGPGVTTLQLSDFANTDDSLFVDGTVIDGAISFGSATISVPEPSSAIVGCLGLATLVYRRRRS